MSPSKAIDPALLRHAVSPTISQADYMHQQEVRSLVAGVFFDATCVLDAYMEARATRLLQFRGYASQVIQQLRSAVAIVDREHRILYANELF
ncbi:MAG: hypothetical protein KDA60_07845, partial [Planctomycetales bacterium]|nr:hypothetical protein [Planctomycetales bacterium]